MRRYLDQMTSVLLDQMWKQKTPLIRYGRRKRKHRRIFPHNLAAFRITFADEAIKAVPVTHSEMWKSN